MSKYMINQRQPFHPASGPRIPAMKPRVMVQIPIEEYQLTLSRTLTREDIEFILRSGLGGYCSHECSDERLRVMDKLILMLRELDRFERQTSFVGGRDF
ncbi:hypothetical protein [Citrobacter sp. FP75]|uniref:hypothetical protein n=1 Tax=Citrobacter sp. FP75 TaxID=1852949 RepID=UPI001BC97AFE|nr:hypothetical protein [Citrobacter sp. FP75]